MAFPDRTIPTTQGPTMLSGGSWNSSFPLTNLQDTTDERMSTMARSTDATTGSTIIKGTFTIDRDIRVFVLQRHNLSLSATVRLDLYTDAAWSTPVTTGSGPGQYTPSAINAWSTFYPPGALNWGHPSLWTGQISVEDQKGYLFDYLYVLPSQVICKSYKVTIVDTGNTDGYVQLARCILAPGWQPNINMAFGAGVQWNDPSEMTKSLGGVKWFNRKTKFRSVTGTIDSMTTESGVGAWFELQRQIGITDELYFVFDPDDVYQAMKLRSFLCTFKQLDPLTFPYNTNCAAAFALEEVL